MLRTYEEAPRHAVESLGKLALHCLGQQVAYTSRSTLTFPRLTTALRSGTPGRRPVERCAHGSDKPPRTHRWAQHARLLRAARVAARSGDA